MTAAHVCRGGGLVVAASEWLPSSHYDYNWFAMGPAIGCSRLGCSRCGLFLVSRVIARADLGAILAAPPLDRPHRLHAMAEHPSTKSAVRVYACSCRVESVEGAHVASEPAYEQGDETEIPWACGGHPALDLPATLDGESLQKEADWPLLVRAHFTDARAVPDPMREIAGFWIARLYAVLEDYLRPRLAWVVAVMLEDPDPRVRFCALRFFRDHFDVPQAESVGQIVLRRPELFPTAPVFERKQGLRSMAVEALSWIVPRHASALDALRLLATTPPGIGGVVATLQQYDAAWLAANAPRIVRS